MIELLVKAIQMGIDLLREGAEQRKRFFSDVVVPIQTEFEKMYRQHVETFSRVREMLEDLDIPDEEIAKFIYSRVLEEHGTTEVLLKLTKLEPDALHQDSPKRSQKLNDLFERYIALLARCLIDPVGRREDPLGRLDMLGYYATLLDMARMKLAESSEPKLSRAALQGERRQNLYDLDHRLVELHRFYADALGTYLELQRACSKV